MKKTRRAGELLADSLAGYVRMPVEEGKIRAIRTDSNRAIAAADIAGVSASLADDFVVVIGDGTMLTRDAYIAAFEHGFGQPLPVTYERIADEVLLSRSLPIAAEHGHWVGRLLDGHVLYTGTYMAMWRHTEAGWRLRSELFASLS